MEPTDDTRNARLSKRSINRAELDQLEGRLHRVSSCFFLIFLSLKQLLRELEKEEEEIEIEDEGKEKSSFKPPKVLSGYQAWKLGALGKVPKGEVEEQEIGGRGRKRGSETSGLQTDVDD